MAPSAEDRGAAGPEFPARAQHGKCQEYRLPKERVEDSLARVREIPRNLQNFV
tara:strand:+ start:7469 stop:7627 length:159 start_codon:yes stop_codon:yes gene_type:complete